MVHFRHPEGLFTIDHSSRWRQRSDPEGMAALQCVSDTGDEIFDVLAMNSNAPRSSDIADIIADGIEKQIRSYASARVAERAVLQTGNNGRCLRVRGEYVEAGHKMVAEYYIASVRGAAIYVALKCIASRFPAARADLVNAWSSLSAPWLGDSGHASSLQSAAAAAAPRSSGSRLWLWIGLAIAVAAGTAYWWSLQPQ